jgi:hypothetical protein
MVVSQELLEELEERLGIVVPAQHNDGGDPGQLLQSSNAAMQIRIRGANGVEHVSRVENEMRLGIAREGESLLQDLVVILGAGAVVGEASQVPIGDVQESHYNLPNAFSSSALSAPSPCP